MVRLSFTARKPLHYWRAQCLSIWHRHRLPPFQQVSSSNFCPVKALRSTVSAVIVKWKCLGATTAQPQSGRPHKLTERDSRVLKRVASENCLSSEATSEQELFVGSFMKWVSMAEQSHTSLRSPGAIGNVVWSVVKLAAIGLWSSGNAFSGVMNHASPSGSPMDNLGLADTRRTLHARMHSDNCKVWWRRNNGLGLFF